VCGLVGSSTSKAPCRLRTWRQCRAHGASHRPSRAR
jgi:hypothetical protein